MGDPLRDLDLDLEPEDDLLEPGEPDLLLLLEELLELDLDEWRMLDPGFRCHLRKDQGVEAKFKAAVVGWAPPGSSTERHNQGVWTSLEGRRIEGPKVPMGPEN